VAVNLRGIDKDTVGRGRALLTPGRFLVTDVIDVRVHGDPVADLPATVTLHAGSAAVPARVRPLGADTARLRLGSPLPLRIGDRALLRDPGRHHVAGGVTVLDVAPSGLTRRGAAAARANELAAMDGVPDLAGELRRRRLARREDLARMGVNAGGNAVAGEWLADPAYWAALRDRLAEEVARHARDHPLEPGAPVEALRRRLGLPDRALVEALVRPPLGLHGGRISAGATAVPGELVAAIDRAFATLADRPFAAPDAYRLAELGLGARQLGAAVRAGLVVRLAENVILRAGTPQRAIATLAGLPQPFTLSEARRALDTSRRVIVPLLEHLDGAGLTRRLPDDRRTVAPA
jgi:selenocysteine-specific elongation factor